MPVLSITATRFTLPSFNVESHSGRSDKDTINTGMSNVRMINDFFRTLVMYSLRITNPNLFIVLRCYGLYKDVVHGGQLFVVAHHVIAVENQLCKLVIANIPRLLQTQVDELVVGFHRQELKRRVFKVEPVSQKPKTEDIQAVLLSYFIHFPLQHHLGLMDERDVVALLLYRFH